MRDRFRLRRLSLVVGLCVAACSAACSAPSSDRDRAPAGGTSTGTAPTFRAALLTAGPVSDAGWYAGAYDGLMMLRDSLGAEVSHQQTRTPAEFDEAFRSYAAAGYDLIFAHGFEYQDAAMRAGAEFPDVTIIVSSGGRVSANVVPLIFTLEEASYLAGVMAAGMTVTGTLGMIGGVAIPPVQGTFHAYEAGAKSVKPNVRVLETYIGNWDDVGAAKEAAVAQLRRGADVLVHNTDAASFGVFQAVREAVEAGDRAWVIGMNNDQNDIAPEVTLGSAVIDIPTAFLKAARAWQAGEVGGKPLYEGLAEGVIDFVVNPAVADRIPPEVMHRLDEAREGIRSGTIRVPRVAFVEGEEGMPPDTSAAPTGGGGRAGGS